MPGWDFTTWTSRNRNGISGERFHGKEKNFADITFLDRTGAMACLLVASGCTEATNFREPMEPITYHIEVKTTEGGPESTFALSQNQMDKARQYTLCTNGNASTPKNIYIIARVYNVGTTS